MPRDLRSRIETFFTLAVLAERGMRRRAGRVSDDLERGFLFVYHRAVGEQRWTKRWSTPVDERAAADRVYWTGHGLWVREGHATPLLAVVFRASVPNHREDPFPFDVEGTLYLEREQWVPTSARRAA